MEPIKYPAWDVKFVYVGSEYTSYGILSMYPVEFLGWAVCSYVPKVKPYFITDAEVISRLSGSVSVTLLSLLGYSHRSFRPVVCFP